MQFFRHFGNQSEYEGAYRRFGYTYSISGEELRCTDCVPIENAYVYSFMHFGAGKFV